MTGVPGPYRGFRVPTAPGKILRERRPPVWRDALRNVPGERKRRYTDLNETDRARFDAQLAVWQAGVALIREIDAMTEAIRILRIDTIENRRFLQAVEALTETWIARRHDWDLVRTQPTWRS